MKIIIIESVEDLMEILNNSKKEQKIKEVENKNHIQNFYKWAVYKNVKLGDGEIFSDFLFTTDDLTESVNLENIRTEFKIKFPFPEFKVVESVKKHYRCVEKTEA